MELHAIAAFFVPLSPDDTREMQLAARRTRLSRTTNGDAEDDTSAADVMAFTPLRSSPPLAFVGAHLLCRVVAETAQEGVQVGFTHYQRPEPPPLPAGIYVWDISPPPAPELTVRITRLPLSTSGFSEGLWWLRTVGRTGHLDSPFHHPNAAITRFLPMCPMSDIRVVLEKENQVVKPRHTRGAQDGAGGAVPIAEVVSGSKESPIREKDLILFGVADKGYDSDISGVPFTSLELQQLCFQPSAMRLLPCLFGDQLSTIQFSRCTCVFDPWLLDEHCTRYSVLSSNAKKAEEMAVVFGITLNQPEILDSVGSSVSMPFGAAGLSYLSLCGCGGEAFWMCIQKFFLCPQCDNVLPSSQVQLTPLTVLDVGDNKSLSTKQLRDLLRAVKQRNTIFTVNADGSHALVPTEVVSLRELNTSFTYAINGIKWRREFAGLGCNLTRLAMARCDVDGDTVLDVLCAGEADVQPPTISESEEPFSNAVRRLLLLDMRWNFKVKSATIKQLRDDHAIHCKHLRVAGTGINMEEGQRFATTVTP